MEPAPVTSDEEEDDNDADMYEYASASSEPDEEYDTGSDDGCDDLDLDDPKNWHTPDGLEPAYADTPFNRTRYCVRQMMHYLNRFEAGVTGHASFDAFWDVFKVIDLVPYGFDKPVDKQEDPSPFDYRDEWGITKTELRRLLGHATRDKNGRLPDGMQDFERAIAYAPDELPDRIPIDPNNLPDP